jgi:TRAP-type transport system small permease protein
MSNFIRKIENIETKIDLAVKTWISLMVLVMFLVISIKVILFKLFGYTMNWYLEVSQMCLIHLTYFGAALAFRKNEHIAIDFFVNLFPEKVRTLLDFFVTLLLIPFLVILLNSSLTILFKAKSSTPMLGLPHYIYYFPIFGGSLILFIYAFLELLRKTNLYITGNLFTSN